MAGAPADPWAQPVPARPGVAPRHGITARGWLGIAIVVVVVFIGLMAIRYGPVALTAWEMKNAAQTLSDELHGMGPADLTHDQLAHLHSELDGLANDVGTMRNFLDTDPLVGIARGSGRAAAILNDANSLLLAATDLAGAGQTALSLGDRFVALREGAADQSLLAGVVALMAGSTDEVDHLHDLIGDAQARLAAIPPTANTQIRHVADLMSQPLQKYAPLLDQYRELDGILPGILGWGGAKRYLVLAMDPAELRPQGGYTGTVGVVTFDKGSMSDMSFQDVYRYDLTQGVPYVQPPDELQSHLLGDQSWQLADAAWSPDFPTAAQNALKLYTNESKDQNIDGVISLTTFAVDRLMQVTGPITVGDGYNVTVKPGDVTMQVLAQTRGVSTANGTDRKAFLNSLASTLLQKLFSLPQAKWVDLYNAFQDISKQRLMQVWFKDTPAETIAADGPIGGELLQAPGDYLYVVEGNVAPPSKYNLVVKRADVLNVVLGADGSADETLRLLWENDSMRPGEPYATIRADSTSPDGLYGTYARVVTNGSTDLVNAVGQASDPISGAETIDQELGRNVIGNYLLIDGGTPTQPGTANLTYEWTAPNAAVENNGTWDYNLTIQRQPAIGPKSVTVQVTLPPGATVSSLSAGATADGNVVTFATPLTTDEQLQITYALP